MKKPEYIEGPKARENFERGMIALFKVPKTSIGKARKKGRKLTAPRKAKRAANVGPTSAGNYSKVETRTNCSGCGKETTVPFKPTQGRPVFCRECFQQTKTSAASE